MPKQALEKRDCFLSVPTSPRRRQQNVSPHHHSPATSLCCPAAESESSSPSRPAAVLGHASSGLFSFFPLVPPLHYVLGDRHRTGSGGAHALIRAGCGQGPWPRVQAVAAVVCAVVGGVDACRTCTRRRPASLRSGPPEALHPAWVPCFALRRFKLRHPVTRCRDSPPSTPPDSAAPFGVLSSFFRHRFPHQPAQLRVGGATLCRRLALWG